MMRQDAVLPFVLSVMMAGIGYVWLVNGDDTLIAAIEQLDQAERAGEAGYPVQMITQAKEVLAKIAAMQAFSPHARVGAAISVLERAIALGSSGKTREAQDLIRRAVINLSQAADVRPPPDMAGR